MNKGVYEVTSMDGILPDNFMRRNLDRIPVDISSANQHGGVVAVSRPMKIAPHHRPRLLFYSELAKLAKSPTPYTDPYTSRHTYQPNYSPNTDNLSTLHFYEKSKTITGKLLTMYKTQSTSFKIRRLNSKRRYK